MDDELSIDDIRRVTRLLSQQSLARINAVNAEAVAELLPALSRYWESAAVSLDTLRQHDVSELLPFFDRYAERRYDAYAAELLPHFSDVDQYALHLMIHVTDNISNEIRPGSGFMPKSGFSGEWKELVHMLINSEPDRREALRQELSEPSGDWEIYLGQSFSRHLSKRRIKTRKWDPEITKAVQEFELIFQLKYQLHLRLFKNWWDFDLSLRAHLANRLAFWQAKAYRRLAKRPGVVSPDAEGTIPRAKEAFPLIVPNLPERAGAATPKADDALLAQAANLENRSDETDRAVIVNDFLQRCNEVPDLSVTLIRKHISLAVGHKSPRQFQYWQARSGKASDQDGQNFRRILAMKPAEFVEFLKRKRIIQS